MPLFELCLEARLLPVRPWRILAGQGLDREGFARLQQRRAGACPDRSGAAGFPGAAGALRAVDQPGRLLRCSTCCAPRGRPSFIPFDAGNETEQGVRAQAMEQAGLAACLRIEGLSPDALAAAALRQLAAPPEPALIDREGAAGAVAAITQLAQSPPRAAGQAS